SPRFQLTPRLLDFVCDEFFVGKNGSIFRGENFIGQSVQRVTRDGFVSLAAKDQTDWRIFTLSCPMFTRVVQIHMHLPRIGVSELAAFEINHHQAVELAVKEQQIDAIPFVADSKPPLPSDKSEVPAEL